MEIPVIKADSLAREEPGEQTIQTEIPKRSPTCTFIEGTPEKMVEQLLQILSRSGVL